ncbi:MAG: hypothetical protein SYR96_13720 [Actinomycetota bacterium]|nr:hypothetical protein [Actinomycetota bacterium]
MRPSPYGVVAFRHDGRRLAMSAPNGELTLWDTTDPAYPQRAGRLRAGRGITAAEWNPAVPDLLATASADGTSAVWRVPPGGVPEQVAGWAALPERARHVGWVAGGSLVYSMTEHGRVTVWDVAGGYVTSRAEMSDRRPVVAAHYRAGEIVAVTDSGWARLWHPRRRPGEWVRLTDRPVGACTWSSTWLVVAGVDGQATCFDAEFQPVRTLRVARARPWAVACSDDGRLVASFGDNRVIAVDHDGAVGWETALHGPAARSVGIAGDLVALSGGQPRPVLLALLSGSGVAM